MAELTPPVLHRLRAERLRVLPLWSWTLAAASCVVDGREIVGVGFDRRSETAKTKARAEMFERRVYDAWFRSGVSPFTGMSAEAPPPTSGFAAHAERAESERRAFLEWRERALLAAVHDGRARLVKAAIPDQGIIFEAALTRLSCRLSAHVSLYHPFVALVIGELSPSGVIFGSACRTNATDAVKAALAECLRKTAFLAEWRRSAKQADLFIETVNFWLSPAGSVTARAFVQKAPVHDDPSAGLPMEPEPANQKTLRLGEFWISHYLDPRFTLPDVNQRSVPLV